MLAVTASAHASAAALTGVAALSPGLRTKPLPATHAWVGYGWQNNRLYHSFKVQQLHEQPRVAPSHGWAAGCLSGVFRRAEDFLLNLYAPIVVDIQEARKLVLTFLATLTKQSLPFVR